MTFNDLKNFSWGDIGTLTLGQLQLDKLELLRLAASGEINLPDSTWTKLCDLCRQTVNDLNRICPDNQLETPECISSSSSPMTPERIMQIITFIMAVITFIRGFMPSQADVTNITINNYDISVEGREQLQHDLDDILKYLSEPEEI